MYGRSAKIIAQLAVAAVVMAVSYQFWQENKPAPPAPPQPPIKVAYHRKSIAGGFMLYFDKPLVKEENGTKATVYGIGRANMPFLREGDSQGADGALKTRMEYREQMIVLVKLAQANTIFGEIRPYSTTWDAMDSNWFVDTCYGSSSLTFQPGSSRSYLQNDTGVRLQPIVCRIPSQDTRSLICSPGYDFTPCVTAVRLDGKPTFGPSTIANLQKTTLKTSKTTKIRLADWSVDNPALATQVWSGYKVPKAPKRVQPLRFISLRFFCVAKGDDWGPEMLALVYGTKGEKVLLHQMTQWMGSQTSPGYLGLKTTWVEESPYALPKNTHNRRVIDLNPNGPASKAGIKVGDIIKDLYGSHQMDDILEKPPVGMPVTLTIIRNGTSKKITVVPGDYPGNDPLTKGMYRNGISAYEEMLKDIPHTGNAQTGMNISGSGKIGAIRMVSYDPVPADFHPAKVAIYVAGTLKPMKPHSYPEVYAADQLYISLPEIPIPVEFWKK